VGIQTFVLAPLYGMSPCQAAQMWSVDDPAIHNLAIRASFDPCQRIVKKINDDKKFKEKYGIGAVNSINWARIAAQVVYYFWAQLQVRRGDSQPVDFAVPTGNFGNIYAALVAKIMGLPIRDLVLATNENDVLNELFTHGIYKPRAKTITTTSPSMDITAASNFERCVFHMFNGDTQKIAALWKELAETGTIDLSGEMERIRATGIVSYSVPENASHQAIRLVHERTGIIIDPHTAVAMEAAFCHAHKDVPIIVMETAQPCKFDDTITAVLGHPAPRPEAFVGIENRPQFKTDMDPDVEKVKDFVRMNA
jgi:threonine synthase